MINSLLTIFCVSGIALSWYVERLNKVDKKALSEKKAIKSSKC